MDARKPLSCLGCPLAEVGKGFLRSEGAGTNGVLLFGEAAGSHEAKASLPFRPNAPAGGLLERVFRISGLPRQDFTLFNIVNCQPPDNDLTGAYAEGAISHCRQYTEHLIGQVKPRILLALGNTPLRELTGDPKASISEKRGYVLKSKYGIPLISSFHPSFLVRGAEHLLGVLAHDVRQAVNFSKHGVPDPLPTHYNLNPSEDDCRAYIQKLRDDPSLAISYDIETASIIGEDEPESWSQKRIIQIQFSSSAGDALVMPLNDDARAILATPNPKLTWNGRLSDDVALKAHGIAISGESYDCMTMWSHLQPGFAGRDASDDEDKGVPARLLNLQAAVSFYFPHEGCWKGTVKAPGPGLGGWLALQANLRYYGARDADLTWRIGTRLMATLKAQGLWDGWYRYKHQLGLVLTKMSERGLPIDRDAQTKLRIHIEEQEQRLDAELQDMIPTHLRPFKEYKGWPKDLREAVKAAGLYVKNCKPHQFPDHVVDCGYELKPFDDGESRLCKVSPFNPRSGKQVLAYIEWQCRRDSRWFIPKHIDTKKPTTNKAGIEALIDATGDPALKHIETCKKISKLKDYCGEKWQPADDGRVHAAFRVGITGTGQTTATNPPIQTYPKHFSKDDKWLEEIGHRIKSIIKAPPGYVMIETDMRGFHARMQAFLAEDAAYYRLANLDTHSYLAAYYVGVPDKDTLLDLDDDALLKRLKEIKTQYDFERNYLCKRVSFLNQYGGKAEKAATILRLPRMQVQAILDIAQEQFKPAFKDLPERVDAMLRRHPKLTTAFGFPRYFWDSDPNQAIAFWVASPAHCTIQDAVLRLDERGALERYGACNLMHDALWWCCPEDLAEECVAVAKEELGRPSVVLVNSLGSFTCAADAKMGRNMASLQDA